MITYFTDSQNQTTCAVEYIAPTHYIRIKIGAEFITFCSANATSEQISETAQQLTMLGDPFTPAEERAIAALPGNPLSPEETALYLSAVADIEQLKALGWEQKDFGVALRRGLQVA